MNIKKSLRKKSSRKKRPLKDGSKKIGRFTITRVSEKDSIIKSLNDLSKTSINLNIEDFLEYKKLVKNYNTKNIDILIKKIINTDFCQEKHIKKNIDIFKEKYINKLLQLQKELNLELEFKSPISKRRYLSPIYEEDVEDIIPPYLSTNNSYNKEPDEIDTVKKIYKHRNNPNKSRVVVNGFTFDIEDDNNISHKSIKRNKKSPKRLSRKK